MRRGFKSWCERCAQEQRALIGLDTYGPLEPKDLAQEMGVMVWRPDEIAGLPTKYLDQLLLKDPDNWSAVTIAVGEKVVSIINSSHPPTRGRNSLAHELAHLILEHKPGRVDLSDKGHLLLSSYPKEQEEEADWLAGTLLVPRDGLIRAHRKYNDVSAIAGHFGVSADLINWRIRMTGVARQLGRVGRRF